jgi:hypothetical protein
MMHNASGWSPPLIRHWSPPLRFLALGFVLLVDMGVAAGLALVALTTGATRQGIADRFRGSDAAAVESGVAEQFAKPLFDMLLTTHNHVIPFALIFLALGFLLACAEWPRGRLKNWLVLEPFIATFTTFGGLWLMRYVHHAFLYWVLFSSTLLYVGFYFASLCILREGFARKTQP